MEKEQSELKTNEQEQTFQHIAIFSASNNCFYITITQIYHSKLKL